MLASLNNTVHSKAVALWRSIVCIAFFSLIFAAISLTSGSSMAVAQTFVKMPSVSIDTADKILRARTADSPAKPARKSKKMLRIESSGTTTVGCASSSLQPIEIITLANSLKCDLDLIYEYVYNNIEYEPQFGSNKGALGTLLDQRGSDIDQAQLFVSLLNVSGITQTNFIYGYITVTGTTAPPAPCNTAAPIEPASGWLGVTNDAIAIGTVLSNGGIPWENGVINGSNGTLECLDAAHVWVQVTLSGTNYVFDPSFKQHTVSSGLSNLGTVLGYNQSQFLTDAGGTQDTVSISSINRSKLRADLTSFANNLITYIKANNPAYRLSDIIGGKTIIPLAGSPVRQTSLPYISNNQPSGFPQNWGGSVPNAYRSCLAVSMPGVSSQEPCNAATTQTTVLYADQTYGQRITVFSVPDPAHSGNYIPMLLVNGAVPSTGTNTGPSTAAGQPWGIYVNVTHPYVSTFANQSKVLTVNAGGSYLIGAGWGRVGRGMVAKHQQLLAQALSSPSANPASETVLGESLAVISYNWLAEGAAQQLIGDSIGKVTTQYHHGVGITAQTEIQASGSQGPYVDLPLNELSITQQTCWPSSSCPLAPLIGPFYNFSGTVSTLESAVLQQTQAPTPNMIAASTVQLVDQNATTGAKTFFADGTTYTGQSNYISSIRAYLTSSYSSADLATIDQAITGVSPPVASSIPHNQALIPTNGNQSVGLWQGAGYTIISQSSGNIAIEQKISGSLDGGFSGTDVPTDELVPNTDSTLPPPAAAPNIPSITNSLTQPTNPTYAEPVDAVAGSEVYSNTDLTMGSGSFPYALSFARTYQSSSNLVDVGMGNGWTHSYSLTAEANSAPYEGLGASSPIRAANAIAAIYVGQNLLGTLSSSPPSLPPQQSITLAWMVDHWLTDRLTNNSVVVTHPTFTENFIALPYADGATSINYTPPLGTATNLTGSAIGTSGPTTFTYVTKDGQKLSFGSSPTGAVSSWTYPNGMAVNFSYNGSGLLSTVTNTLGRQLTLSYASGHVSSVSDGSRSANYSYGSTPGYNGSKLVSSSDPLGNITRYSYDTSGTYDTAGHLTQIFYPNSSNFFVTNFYDGLGRVCKQQNANSQATLFYFAGSRTEIIDPVGDRQVTYQTPSGQITMSAAVLSSSYGDVFQSTPQQNGIVNVALNQYDGLNRLTLATAPEDGTVGYAYSLDFENNIITKTQTAKPGSPLSALTTNLAYDPQWNKPTRITDPRGIISTMRYDGLTGNLLTSSADTANFNATSQFTYTSTGLLATGINPLGALTTYTYNTTGDLTQIIHDVGHLNQTTGFTYDKVGNVLSETDPNGNVTANVYDADRRLISSLSPTTPGAAFGVTTAYSYDAVGQLLQTIQSSAGTLLRQTSTTYSPTGKVLTVTDPNGHVTISTYDGADRLASVTDPVGRVTNFAYDALSRKLSVSNPAFTSPLVQMSYTPDGLLASLTNANSYTTSYTPDGFDRLSTTTYPNSSTEVLTYDADNNILTRQTRVGSTITYTYDTLNRLSTKSAPSEATVTNSYDLAGHLISASDTSAAVQAATTSGTVSTITASYDAQNNLISKTWSPVQAQAPPSASSTASFTYTHSAANQRIGQTTTDNTYWSYPTATAASTSYTPNNLDQYTAIGTITPTYDGNGNLTFDGTTTYGYDAESRLISATQGGTTIATYAYDPLGHRKAQTLSGTTTLLVNDAGNNPLLDYAGVDGSVQRWYTFGTGSNALLNQVNTAAGTRATLIPDIQGSIVGSLDSSTGTLTKAGFQPYGESASTASATFGYTGARIAVAGLYDMRARFYSPILGRFLSTDLIGSKGGINLYAYAKNDPLNLADAYGLSPDSPAPEEEEPTTIRSASASGLSGGGNSGLTAVGLSASGNGDEPLTPETEETEAIGSFSPINPGPLASDIANTFRSATYEGSALSETTTLYRVIGDGGNPNGAFWTRVQPAGPLQSVIDSALDQSWGNSATTTITRTFPAGTQIFEGAAAPQGGLVGGGNQIYIPGLVP